jgi:hypothetical protein
MLRNYIGLSKQMAAAMTNPIEDRIMLVGDFGELAGQLSQFGIFVEQVGTLEQVFQDRVDFIVPNVFIIASMTPYNFQTPHKRTFYDLAHFLKIRYPVSRIWLATAHFDMISKGQVSSSGFDELLPLPLTADFIRAAMASQSQDLIRER